MTGVQTCALPISQAGADTVRAKASEKVPEETKDRARNYLESSKNYLSGKMPRERREQGIWRLKKMIVEIQGHPDCMSSL